MFEFLEDLFDRFRHRDDHHTHRRSHDSTHDAPWDDDDDRSARTPRDGDRYRPRRRRDPDFDWD